MTVVIGIDPHKASHTATAIGPGCVEAATIRLRAARSTPEELLSWAAQWPERRWGVEGARGLGQLLAQQLVAAGEHVVDVPATLSARVRTLETGHGRKTDHIDARAVALVAAQRPDLPRVTADDHCRVLRLLADRRDELTSERRRTINRLHRHLRDLIAGRGDTLTDTDRARLDALLDAHPRLKAGWQALQELHGLYLADDHQGALEALGRFCDLYETGELPEYHDTHTGGALSVGPGLTLSTTGPSGAFTMIIVDTIIAWSDEILAWHHTDRASNGRIEGTNNLLQVLRRSAHGFTNPTNFEARGILVT